MLLRMVVIFISILEGTNEEIVYKNLLEEVILSFAMFNCRIKFFSFSKLQFTIYQNELDLKICNMRPECVLGNRVKNGEIFITFF